MQKPTMNMDEAEVWAIVQGHIGLGHEITSLEIAQGLDLHRTYVRKVIRRLVRIFKKRIIGTTQGYCVPKDQAEWDKALDSLWRRGVSILARWSDMKGISIRQALEEVGQGNVDLDWPEECYP